jgi:PAS domain S-box-containing protein
MTERWVHEIESLRARLVDVLEREGLGDDARTVATDTLAELTVIGEGLDARNAELVATRTELERERARYRELFETVPDGYLVTDAEGLVREVNSSAATMFGRPVSRIVGRPLAGFVDARDRRAFDSLLARLVAEGAGAHARIDLAVHDDVSIPVSFRAMLAASRAEPGHSEVRWLVEDRRGLAEVESLRQSEERLRQLFDTSGVGIVLVDGHGSIVFTNQSADRLLDRARSAVAMDDWLSSTHPDDRSDMRAALVGAIEGGGPRVLRHRVQHGGATRWVEHSITPFEDGGGAVCTCTDVTDAELDRRALERSLEFTDALLDTVGALVIVADVDGRIQRFNAACEAATGFRAASIIGRPALDILVPEEERAEVVEVLSDLVRTGRPSEHRNHWITADGGRRMVSWTNTVLRDGDTVVAVIGTGIDVTDELLLEARVAQAERLESLGRLVAGIAHDFNNTLSVLRLRIDRAARRSQEGDVIDDLNEADAVIDRSQQLIADLVAFGRQQSLAPEPTNVNAEMERVRSVLRDLLGNGISIVVHADPDQPLALVDRARFEQLLTNLVINARDAMPNGGRLTLESAVDHFTVADLPPGTTLDPGDYVRVVVSDTGTGIEPADLPRIFDPYFTTKPPARGTGLGLATAHGTVTQSGGAIVVESRPGHGTTFTIWLPLGATESPATPDADDDGSPAADAPIAVVVDDDPDMRDLLAGEVEELGFRVLVAHSAEQALDMIDARLDLMILDVQLPGINGVELADRLHDRFPGAATLYVSGAPESVLAPILPRTAVVLRKPFTLAELMSAVRGRPAPDTGRGQSGPAGT